MALQFTQEEIERRIADILKHGDIQRISNVSGIGYSYIDQMLNPNDERKSYIVGSLQIICALDEIDAERGEALFQIFKTLRALSKKRTGNDCRKMTAARLNKETSDAVDCHITDRPLYEQLSEAVEAVSAAEAHKQAILDAINKEMETANSPRKRVSQ